MDKKKKAGNRSPKKGALTPRRTIKKSQEQKSGILVGLAPYLLGLAAVFFAACLIFRDSMGVLGSLVNDWLKGWFSVAAYLVPAAMFVRAVCFTKDRQNGALIRKSVLTLLCVLFAGAAYGVFFNVGSSYDYLALYESGKGLLGGGSLCGLVSWAMSAVVGHVAAGIISALLALFLGAFIFGKSPVEVLDGISGFFMGKVSDLRDHAKDKKIAREEERERQRQQEEEEAEEGKRRPPVFENEDDAKPRKRRGVFADADTGEAKDTDEGEEGELPGFGEDQPLVREKPKGEPAYEDEDLSVGETLDDLFGKKEDPELRERFDGVPWESDEEDLEAQATLEVHKSPVGQPKEEVFEDQEEEGYRFPPVSLLKYEPVKKTGNLSEQERTAEKLVEALASFGVKTKVLDIAVGPTVTRYELQPDTGVRVRSIVNLADDIALKLAASGVRIEAPIPGKEAVGIEVPNKSVATVYLRELIESSAFTDADCKITVCLGMDVAGQPIYCNITKMPHLLIAGATNMGKSVCMNSVITSILYKATPDEVKMILIDPKKVEMSIYNGIPHLIVPVVSEPKKAAGALAWAVSEMERRFALIEEEGVRNIANYNKAIAADPDRKKEPYIVIIIDELADLMMTARDDVESSICRLAQKARAAGIHLIIGTQRPSVDVITGLIKANFPSRIAFTVSSQVDSRTIIDMAGAEKLMGRGDMLYAPVGSTKPTRVQGSFVSEAEVEAITDFLREHKTAQYSQEIQEQIEKEAARCGEKKHGGFDSDPDNMGGEAGENDPMLPQAIKIAIENGKISTSFIQRKLQLGYSRAGRITDAMGNMGVIGPFNGSKPREVLWTMNQYMEWLSGREDQG